ncbi:MAG: S41 family peptidase [Phycisphaerales bacterium]|nr:S41 family peptidase [Phycisphaerales bacterium]
MSPIPTIVAAVVGITASILAPDSQPAGNESVISSLAQEIRDNYVFPKIGQSTADYLLKRSREGAYDGLDDNELGSMLTQDLQAFTNDRHFGVRVIQSSGQLAVIRDDDEPANTTPNGFMRVERLDGNIGYLKLDGFVAVADARKNTDAAMQLLSGSSALIFDLRENGGGDPETVQLISSYLFDPDEPVHLNSLYFRPTDETTEFWTHSEIDVENAMPDVPVYVLTSSYTFSAAEEFTYNLKCRNRATVIGENTGGGAHPVNGFVIDERFQVRIPVGRAINPITKDNWEGTGVSPDIEVPALKALDVAVGEVLERMTELGDDRAKWGLIHHRARTAPLSLSSDVLAEYAGQYIDRELKVENDELMYRRKGRPNWSRLIAIGDDRFVIDGVNGFMLTFQRNDEGAIRSILGSYEQGHYDHSLRE